MEVRRNVKMKMDRVTSLNVRNNLLLSRKVWITRTRIREHRIAARRGEGDVQKSSATARSLSAIRQMNVLINGYHLHGNVSRYEKKRL